MIKKNIGICFCIVSLLFIISMSGCIFSGDSINLPCACVLYEKPPKTTSTGVWEFVSADGENVNIITQLWYHSESDILATYTKEPWNYAHNSKKDGVLLVWFDKRKKRFFTISEWENGINKGVEIYWHPSGKLRYVSSARAVDHNSKTYYKNMLFFKKDGSFEELKIDDIVKDFP